MNIPLQTYQPVALDLVVFRVIIIKYIHDLMLCFTLVSSIVVCIVYRYVVYDIVYIIHYILYLLKQFIYCPNISWYTNSLAIMQILAIMEKGLVTGRSP